MIEFNLYNLTEEHLKSCDYKLLCSYFFWNHLKDKEYRESEVYEFKTKYYGKFPGGASFGDQWQDPNYKEGNTVRELSYIEIKWDNGSGEHLLWITHKGTMNHYYYSHDKSKPTGEAQTHANTMNVVNWMVENELYTITGQMKNY